MRTAAGLEEALYQHGRAFHGAQYQAAQQIGDARQLLHQAQALGITDLRASRLVPQYQALLSALHYKEGDAASAGTWAELAIQSATAINDPEGMAYGYIRKIQTECWYGIPRRAVYYAERAMQSCWGHISPMQSLWLASHAMRAYAMTGDLTGYELARKAGQDKVNRVPTDPKMTAFTFGANQWPQAVAIALTYTNPHEALGWYDTALQMNPRDAVHVTTLDMLHRSMAMIRLGDKEGGLEYAAHTLKKRKSVGPMDSIYRDRVGKVLAQLPQGYQTKQTREIHALAAV